MKFVQISFYVSVLLVFAACGEPIIIDPDAILPDGSRYSGDTKGDKFHGQGVLKYVGGPYYEGGFSDGLMNGKGTFHTDNGFVYEGDFNQGQASGKFVVTNTLQSTIYEGDLFEWKMHGQGNYKTPEYEYEGQFVDGFFNGFGKLTYPNGDIYEGDFSMGEFSGTGTIVYSNGQKYVGNFKEGNFDGEGRFEDGDGAVYDGTFRDGNYHGKGKYTSEEMSYEGEFVNGNMSGKGSYTDYQGNEYVGQIDNWYAHGEGVLTSVNGDVRRGRFESGFLEGEGELVYIDGGVYKGGFSYNEPSGNGRLELADGSIYIGEFSYGSYHGDGTLTEFDASGKERVRRGRWANGKLVFNSDTGERENAQVEIALESHQSLLNGLLDSLPSGKNDDSDVYVLSVAGDGTQSVFRREVEFVNERLTERYGESRTHVVPLINHHDSASTYPLATRRSINTAINRISQKMDIKNDVLFLYLTSHGSDSHELSLKHNGIKLPDFSAKELAGMLENSNIKWKVIVISACFSGGFIPELESDTTLIMTAADSESKSFGCSEDSEMTYFAKALFKEVLKKDPDLSFTNAFSEATHLVSEWETEQELAFSNPQINAPQAILTKLAKMRESNLESKSQ